MVIMRALAVAVLVATWAQSAVAVPSLGVTSRLFLQKTNTSTNSSLQKTNTSTNSSSTSPLAPLQDEPAETDASLLDGDAPLQNVKSDVSLIKQQVGQQMWTGVEAQDPFDDNDEYDTASATDEDASSDYSTNDLADSDDEGDVDLSTGEALAERSPGEEGESFESEDTPEDDASLLQKKAADPYDDDDFDTTAATDEETSSGYTADDLADSSDEEELAEQSPGEEGESFESEDTPNDDSALLQEKGKKSNGKMISDVSFINEQVRRQMWTSVTPWDDDDEYDTASATDEDASSDYSTNDLADSDDEGDVDLSTGEALAERSPGEEGESFESEDTPEDDGEMLQTRK